MGGRELVECVSKSYLIWELLNCYIWFSKLKWRVEYYGKIGRVCCNQNLCLSFLREKQLLMSSVDCMCRIPLIQAEYYLWIQAEYAFLRLQNWLHWNVILSEFFIQCHHLSAGRKAGGAALAWLIVRSAHLTFATACPGERFRQKQFIDNLNLFCFIFWELCLDLRTKCQATKKWFGN